MAERGRPSRGTSNVHGYAYRDNVDTSVSPDLETPDETSRPSSLAPTVTVGSPRTGNPVVDALLGIAGAELTELKKDANQRQAVDGAIDAGLGKGMEEIGKRKSFDDLIFGTRARKDSAAKVKASVGVNSYFSDQISALTHEIRTDPADYITAQREILSLTHAKIKEEHGEDVADSFMALGVQRLEQLVQMQVSQHHEHLQKEASSDFQKDILTRAAVLDKLYTEPGMEMQADADLKELFNENNRPADMTLAAWHTNIAQAILTEANEGSRRLYDYAEQMGVLEGMPESVRAELDAAYKASAPINNMEFIDSNSSLLRAIDNDAVSFDSFVRMQENLVEDWDLIHQYSDQELSNQRARKRRALETKKKDTFDLEAASKAWVRGDVGYLSSLTGSQRQDAADAAITQFVYGTMNPEQRQQFEGASPAEHSSIMYEYLMGETNSPEAKALQEGILGAIVEFAGRSGYKVNSLANVLNNGSTALTFNGKVNPQAIKSLETQRILQGTQGKYVNNLVSDNTLLAEYDILRDSGFQPEEAIAIIDEGRKNPVDPQSFEHKDKESAGKSAYQQVRKELYGGRLRFNIAGKDFNWGKAKIQNEPAVMSKVDELANTHMERGVKPRVAYKAAADEISGSYEMVGTTAVFNGDESLSSRAGLHPGSQWDFNSALSLALDQSVAEAIKVNDPDVPEFEWTGDLSDYYIAVDIGLNAVRLTYSGDDPIQNRNVNTIKFKTLREITNKDVKALEGGETPASVAKEQAKADNKRSARQAGTILLPPARP